MKAANALEYENNAVADLTVLMITFIPDVDALSQLVMAAALGPAPQVHNFPTRAASTQDEGTDEGQGSVLVRVV